MKPMLHLGRFRILDQQNCAVCEKIFTPRPGGYNAVYCSKACKQKKRCKSEVKIYSARYRRDTYLRIKDNPERLDRLRKSGRRTARKQRDWLNDYKMSRGCLDCGFSCHPAALQFDHTGKKSVEISKIRGNKKRVMDEVEKGMCVIRCANCHSIKTWAEKNGIANPSGKSKFAALGDRK